MNDINIDQGEMTIAVFTERDVYATEATVNPYNFGPYDFARVTITNVSFSGTSGAADNEIVLTMKNTGTKSVTVASIKINNQVLSTSSWTGSNQTIAADESSKQATLNGVRLVKWKPV